MRETAVVIINLVAQIYAVRALLVTKPHLRPGGEVFSRMNG